MRRRLRAGLVVATVLTVLASAVAAVAVNIATGSESPLWLPEFVRAHPVLLLAISTAMVIVVALMNWSWQRRYEEELDSTVPAAQMRESWVVDRPTEVDAVVRALRRRRGTSTVGVTTALHGAGGFGKTTLARMVRSDRRVLRRFDRRIYWVTLGRDVLSDALVEKVNDLVRQIAPSKAYPFTDVRQAADHLAAVLAEGPPRLIVLDDIWFEEQLAAFPVAGQCVRLVTTRTASLVASSSLTVRVDQMSTAQARVLLTGDLPELPSATVEALIQETGHWPLLLRLVNKILLDQYRFDTDVAAAAEQLLARLRHGGALQVDSMTGATSGQLDLNDPDQRQNAVVATIEASTGLLSTTERRRFAELAIFAEDTSIEVGLAAKLWEVTGGLDATEIRLLCSRLAGLSLITLTATEHGGEIAVHDVVRDYLRHQLGVGELRELHEVFLQAIARNYFPRPTDDDTKPVTPWWNLPAGAIYLKDNLVEHLISAGRLPEAEILATDIRWLEVRLEQAGTNAPISDLRRVGTPRAKALMQSFDEAQYSLGQATSAGRPTTFYSFVQQTQAETATGPVNAAEAEDVAVLLRWARAGDLTRLRSAARAHFDAAERHARARRTFDERRSRFAALIALALQTRPESAESARDLSLVALHEIHGGDPSEDEISAAVLAYLGPDSAAVGPAVRSHVSQTGPGGLEQLIPLLAVSRAAARIVIGVVVNDPDLAPVATRYLGRGRGNPEDDYERWSAVIERWRRDRRKLFFQLRTLAYLDGEAASLQEAEDRLMDHRAGAPAAADLPGLTEAVRALRAASTVRRFTERDAALRKAVRLAEAVAAEIRSAPTELGVVVAHPAAVCIERVARELRDELIAAHPPKPEITAALTSARIRDNVISVQVRVSNAEDEAPLEAASMTITPVPGIFTASAEIADLSGPLHGGDSETVIVELEVSDGEALPQTVDLDVALTHRAPVDVEPQILRFRLSLPVDHAFDPIAPNPFTDGALGRPVDNPHMFYGRDDMVTRIRERLRTARSPGAGIAIFGEKRTGKSSIRIHLRRRLAEEDALPVVDVGNLGELAPQEDTRTDRNLLGALLWRILDNAEQADAGIIPPGFDRQTLIASPDPVQDFGRVVEEHRRSRPGRRPWIVMIDEFQYLEEWIRRGLIPASLLKAFKAIVERRLFHLVLVGQSEMEQLVKTDPNTFGVFGLERVTYLAEKDAQALIEKPVPLPDGGSRYHGLAVSEIIRLTGGNPFYIQRLCSAMVSYMNVERAGVVTEADVARVVDDLLARLTAADFDNLEAPGDNAPAHRLVTAVDTASGRSSAPLSEVELAYGGKVPEALLNDLVSRDVVRRESGMYRVTVGLYALWLRRYAESFERT
ncbi:hypothetical protein JIG36_45650 [Actinoplanes sp. LDG1-06]|uniref:NB-ARC domain-containing protein n=1 Tax=Paractinoplanes ovalisporus TaxID=2810368 RepID=A0ABS2ASU8_9ACTN|nr:NB-ARC domain-containing protein [Actinoplanes ovalisporus]MBM2622810.1 hypothetical protein [Actinoplanes ovalisporus]